MASKRLSKERCFDVLSKGGHIRFYHGCNYLGYTIRLHDREGNQVGHITTDAFYFISAKLNLKERGSTFLFVVYAL